MKFRITLYILLTSLVVRAQSLTGENLAHFYDPTDEIDFEWILVKQSEKVTVSYAITSKSDAVSSEMFLMNWESRDSYDQGQGKLINADSLLLQKGVSVRGELIVDLKDNPWILLLTITKVTNSATWSYPFQIEKNYPVNGFVREGGQKVLTPYLKPDKNYVIEGPPDASKLFVYGYTKQFASAFPPFTKATGADPILIPDTTFSIPNGANLSFHKEGLYLVQSDTTSAEGFSYRINTATFPKYTRIQDLVEPLIFICTQDEFSQLQQSNGDKVSFDKTVIGITKDKERAKRFMRSYYARVELANQYFSTYKEGWKTDQGMIYIIFGLPDEIRKTSQNEIWYYKNTRTKFVFIKKGSVYDPDYYTLLRDEEFSQIWHNTIDQWRKSRF